MLRASFSTLFRSLLLGCGLLLSTTIAWAQAASVAPHGYDFLTVTELQSASLPLSRLLFAPMFQGKTEIPLETLDSYSSGKSVAAKQRNLLIINEQLSVLTTAGWELTFVNQTGYETRYLFRKPRP